MKKKMKRRNRKMRNRGKLFAVLFLAVCTLFMTQATQAQDSPFTIDNVPNVVGIGLGVIPDYQGSNDYMVGGAPFFRLTYPKSEWYLMMKGPELSANILNHPWLRLGPVLNYRFGRDDDIEDKQVKRMEEIDDTVEAGAFAGIELVEEGNPRQRFIASLQFLGDVGDEHRGYIVSLNARYWYPVHKAVDVSMGVGTTYADDHYMNTYFGVNSKNVGTSGLSLFEAEGGIKDISLSPAVVVHLSMDWHVAVGCKYFYYLGDAKDSPVVDDEGDPSQWLAGLGVAYSW
jgi:outer membrane protein